MEVRHASPAQLFLYLLSSESVWAEEGKLWGRFITQEGTPALVVIAIEERK